MAGIIVVSLVLVSMLGGAVMVSAKGDSPDDPWWSPVTLISLVSPPKVVQPSTGFTVNGNFRLGTTDKPGAGIVGETVTLQRQIGVNRWTDIATSTTIDQGYFSLTAMSQASGIDTYRVYYKCEGYHPKYSTSVSDEFKVTVSTTSKMPTVPTAAAGAPFFGTFTVSGSLKTATGDPVSNGLVTLWKIEPLSGTWIACPNVPDVSGAAHTKQDGTYSFSYYEMVLGTNTYKVKFDGDGTHDGSESAVFTVKV